jgi:hypothetical protein
MKNDEDVEKVLIKRRSQEFFAQNCLYEERCLCGDESFFIKSPKSSDVSEGRRFAYPKEEERDSISFRIKYEKPLTRKAEYVLKSFKNKYIYYAIDDIITILSSDPKKTLNPDEQKNLLTILYSSMLWLHNNLSINFFDIWIGEIYIHDKDKKKRNRFLENDNEHFQSLAPRILTLKLYYKTRLPFKKPDPLW